MTYEHFVLFFHKPMLHKYGEEVPECFLKDSEQWAVFRVERAGRCITVSSYRDGQWFEASEPPSLQDAIAAFRNFVSALQGVPEGYEVREVEGWFRVFDSRTEQPIGALPKFRSFEEAANAVRDGGNY